MCRVKRIAKTETPKQPDALKHVNNTKSPVCFIKQKCIKITGSEHKIRSDAVNSLYVAEAAPAESYVVVSFPTAVCLLVCWFQFHFCCRILAFQITVYEEWFLRCVICLLS
jgi:hypothetical protein